MDAKAQRWNEVQRRRLLQALGAALVLRTLPAGAQGRWWGERPPPRGVGDGVVALRGDVRVNGTRAAVGTPLTLGAEIEVGAGARVVAVVGSEAVMLRENTRLQLPAAGKRVFRLMQGGLLAVFGPRDEPDTILMTTAVLGIRGTGLYAVAEATRSYVCTCYGTVDIAASTDPAVRETIVSRHHDAPRYVHAAEGTAPARIEPAPFIDHTDAELILLETLMGRRVPFGVPGAYEVPRRDY